MAEDAVSQGAPFRLDGLSALVTGASGGIGGAIARLLAAQGARVAVSGTSEARLAPVAQATGGVALAADLADAAAADALVLRAVEALGGLDILVLNAGLTRDGLLMRMKDEDFADVMRINVEAAFRLARAAMRPMMKARFGRIIAITSVVGHTGNPGQANYVASKGALTAMMKAVAAEVATRGVTANCVAPGFIATPMTEVLTDAQKEAIAARIPMGRMGTGEEVAAAVAWLASREAGYVTGATIHVNGGMAML